MRSISFHSTRLHAVILIAVPIVLSGCGIIAGITSSCNYEARFVGVAGSGFDGGVEVATAIASSGAQRGGSSPGLSFSWFFRAPSLEGHIVSAALVNSAQAAHILLDLPIRELVPPYGYDYAYQGALDQRPGDTTTLLGGIFEMLAAGNGVLELTTDLPALPLVRIPLAVTEMQNWHRPNCS